MSYPGRRWRRVQRVVVASRGSGISTGWLIAGDGLGALVVVIVAVDKDITC
jgi:hypothetical protein